MKSCGSRKGSGREMGNYEFNWSGLIANIKHFYQIKPACGRHQVNLEVAESTCLFPHRSVDDVLLLPFIVK